MGARQSRNLPKQRETVKTAVQEQVLIIDK